jgi:hypothetical protein
MEHHMRLHRFVIHGTVPLLESGEIGKILENIVTFLLCSLLTSRSLGNVQLVIGCVGIVIRPEFVVKC